MGDAKIYQQKRIISVFEITCSNNLLPTYHTMDTLGTGVRNIEIVMLQMPKCQPVRALHLLLGTH